MGVVSPGSLSRACVAAVLVSACASHDTTPSASGDGTGTTTSPQLPQGGDYPAGPFGLNVGQVFPRMQLLGYHAGLAPWTTVDTKDYFDPHGLRGINGIYITVSAPWCSGCKLEGQQLPVLWNTQYKARGGRIVTVLLQGALYEPASQATADAWIAAYSTPYDLAVGDVATMLPSRATSSGGVGLPYNYAVDPRTMRIMAIDSGDYFHGDALPGLDAILAQNAK